ncbi:MAG: hypothetical protein OXC58_09965, partial [Acidimicrobiaceae bacterium]|nr:hypothetical protein [Acidimicrobiaceae bacterium]
MPSAAFASRSAGGIRVLPGYLVGSDGGRARRAFRWGLGALLFVLVAALSQSVVVSVASAQTPVVPPAPSNVQVELGG